ncbi:MAG: aspartyl protease family protein [Fimbriimonas sp.]
MPASAFLLPLLWLQSAPVAELPFEMVGGRVYVPAEVGGRKVPMILDSGAGVTLLDADLAKEIRAQTGGEIPVGGAGEQSQRGVLLKDTMVWLADKKAKSNAFLALPLGPIAPFEGRRMHGILGNDLFNRYIVQIDYPGAKVRLYDPKTYGHGGKSPAVPIRIVGMLPQIDLTLDVPTIGAQPSVAMIDTGASGTVTMTAQFGRKHDLANKLPKGPTAPLSGGVGGLTQGRLLRLNSVKIGEHVLAKPVGSLTVSAGGATGAAAGYDCLIGADILRRFVVTFDYAQKRMWFEPATDLKAPFSVDHAGLLLKSEGPEFHDFFVYGTIPESPAAEAGLREGDELTHIDGESLVKHTLDQIRRRFRSGEKPWRLTIRRGNETMEITVKPRPLA